MKAINVVVISLIIVLNIMVTYQAFKIEDQQKTITILEYDLENGVVYPLPSVGTIEDPPPFKSRPSVGKEKHHVQK